MHQHILIATDGSELGDRALDHGFSLARQLNAKVTVLTGTEMWSVIDMTRHAEDRRNPIEHYEAIAAESARKILDAAVERAARYGLACETVHARDLKPAEAIVETANARGCDLIVMGSHGRRGVNRLLLGSETARVLALTTIPVLVYR